MTTKYLYPVLTYNGEGRHGIGFSLFEDKTLAKLFGEYQNAIENYVIHQIPVKIQVDADSQIRFFSSDLCTVEDIILGYMEGVLLDEGLEKHPILCKLLNIAGYADDESLIPEDVKNIEPELLNLAKKAKELLGNHNANS